LLPVSLLFEVEKRRERKALQAQEEPMNQLGQQSFAEPRSSAKAQNFIQDLWGIRYQVADVSCSIDFYTKKLSFQLEHKSLPAFAQVSIGNLKLILSGPGASGSRPMPDGRPQESGGWNRVILKVANLSDCIETLKGMGLRFRNRMETGPGGKQILLDDPDGNPIELFEPA
jgi:glyoxylase I family protein